MATILQLNRIATNRTGAVSDTVTRLQSSVGTSVVNIATQHIPSLPASQITTGEFNAARIPDLPASQITTGTFADAQIPNLSGAKITSGTISGDRLNLGTGLAVDALGVVSANPSTVNLSSVHTFETTTARNAATNIIWHVGDLAIVTAETTSNVPGASVDSNANALLGGGAANQVRAIGPVWDVAASAPESDFAVGSTIRFTNDGGATFRGAGAGGSGADWTITAIAQLGPGTNGIITLDRTPTAADGIDNQDDIFIAGAPTSVTDPIGTYVYTGVDQTAAGVTVTTDWTLLRTQAASGIDASAVVSGTFDDARISTNLARTNELPTIVAGTGVTVVQDATGTAVQYTINSMAAAPVILHAQTGGIQSTGGAGVTLNGDGNITAITAANFTRAGTALTEFPASFSMYANGLKLTDNEINPNVGRTAVSFTQVSGQASTGIEFGEGGTVTFEITYF